MIDGVEGITIRPVILVKWSNNKNIQKPEQASEASSLVLF